MLLLIPPLSLSLFLPSFLHAATGETERRTKGEISRARLSRRRRLVEEEEEEAPTQTHPTLHAGFPCGRFGFGSAISFEGDRGALFAESLDLKMLIISG